MKRVPIYNTAYSCLLKVKAFYILYLSIECMSILVYFHVLLGFTAKDENW